MSTFDPHLETSAGDVYFKGEFTQIACVDPARTFPGLSNANLVLSGSQSFHIDLKWKLTGIMVPLWLQALGGSWTVDAFAESIGPGPELQIATANGGADPGLVVDPNKMDYGTRLVVPAGTLPEGNPGPAGPSGQYKITCSCFLNSSLGRPGFDVTGFAEGPVVRIEDPN